MKYAAVVLLMHLTFTACAQRFTFVQGGATDKNYYVEIPYQDIKGKILIDVEINGKIVRCLFDTGAPCAISKELANQFGSKVINQDIIGDAYGNKDSVKTVNLNAIKIGNVAFNNIPALVLIPDFYKCLRADAVIGSNLFPKSIIQINADRHIIILTDMPDKLSLNKKNSLRLASDKNFQNDPIITVPFKNGTKVEFGFDTGDAGFLLLNERYKNMLDKFKVFDVLSTGYGTANRSVFGLEKGADKYRLKAYGLRFGSTLFTNVITETNNNGPSRIGAKLLKYGIVTLDFINQKFYFESKVDVNDLDQKNWPIQPSIVGSKLLVGIVWSELKDQLKQGEQITAVNGIDCSVIDLCEWTTKSSTFESYDKLTLTIKNDHGDLRDVVITKQ